MKARTLWRSSFAIAGLFSAGAIAGCNGQIGDTIPSGSGGNQGSGGAGATTASGSAGSAGTAASSGSAGSDMQVVIPTGGSGAAQTPESAGPLVMTRLTYREYDHMLADLLGDTTAPAEGGNAWSPDAPNAVGYVAPTSASDLQIDLYNQTADSVVETAIKAAAAGKPAGKLSIPCKPAATSTAGDASEISCATQFITTFGLSAYRRPVAALEQADLLTLFGKVRKLGLAFNESLGAVVKGMIQSPNFLYHWEIGPTKPVVGADGLVPLTSWQVASRLASSLWETMPDATLMQAAQAGQLNTTAAINAQVVRMLADTRAANGLFNFHQQWLFSFGSQGRDLTQALLKQSPLFTPAVAQGIQTEFQQFLASVYTGDGTLQALFTAPYAFVNHDLGVIYGVNGPATGFAKVALDPTQRGGLFTQTAWLATLASDGADNPVYRGLSIYLKVLCGSVGSPPPNVPAVTFKANGTTRQAYDDHGKAICANACHGLFDPPGFAFENYDAIGAFRTTDNGQAVDATGTFVTPGKTTLTFKNAMDLSKQLASNPEAQLCIDRQWTRFMLGRVETMADAGSMAVAYQKAAATTGFSVRDLLATLYSSKTFMFRQPSPGEAL